MKINILGQGHAFYLAEMLTDHGQTADNNSSNYEYYDVNLSMGIWHAPKNIPNHAVFVMGSDCWADHIICPKADLYLLPDLKMFDELNMSFKEEQKIKEWSMPVNTRLFQKLPWYYPLDKRDTLLYANNPAIYKLDKALEVINASPEEKFTMLGTGFQDALFEIPENLLIIRNVPHGLMWLMYLRHKNFKVWWNHPGCGSASIMNYEAFLMGLKSYWNDQEVKELPKEKDSEWSIPELINLLENLKT